MSEHVGMQALSLHAAAPESTADAPSLVLGRHLAVTGAPTAGVRLFARCPPAHSVLVGRCRVAVGQREQTAHAIALPANTPHRLLALEDAHACVAYLDARRYSFEDAQRLAVTWAGFVPGRDDLREAFGDAQKLPQRRVDKRLLEVLSALESDDLTIEQAAAQVDLSPSRLTHLMSETLGAPPRTWRAWFKLQRAIHAVLFESANLTRAAHLAGFVDSAHLTRTCKQLMGVRPAQMLPQTVYLSSE
jgi:AraC-like DNA-binding protein